MAKKDDKAPPEASKVDTQKKEAEPLKPEWEQILEGKYKTPEEMAKAYKELEKKMGEQGEEVRQSREFAATVQPLLEVIRDDSELFTTLDKKLRERGQAPQSSDKSDVKDGKTTDQDDVRTVASDLVLARFEEKYGIDKLSPDKRRELRQKIGDEIYDLTGLPMTKVDLRRLSTTLEKAYFLANKDELVEKSKLEALMSAKGIDEAGIPSIPSSPGTMVETLTPDEARVATKMGLTREQYLEGKKVSGR